MQRRLELLTPKYWEISIYIQRKSMSLEINQQSQLLDIIFANTLLLVAFLSTHSVVSFEKWSTKFNIIQFLNILTLVLNVLFKKHIFSWTRDIFNLCLIILTSTYVFNLCGIVKKRMSFNFFLKIFSYIIILFQIWSDWI